MIRFKIQEVMADWQFQKGTRVTMTQLSAATGISRVTLSKMVNQKNYSTVTDNLDKLCEFFECRVEDLVEHIPDQSPES